MIVRRRVWRVRRPAAWSVRRQGRYSRLTLARVALLLGLVTAASAALFPAYANSLRSDEVPIVALLVDSRQILTDQDRTRLTRLANELPFTPNFMICVLQSVSCMPPEPARNNERRSENIRRAIDTAGKYAHKSASDGVPSTQDISYVLDDGVRPAFTAFWNELDPEIAKGERERQVWVVLVSPEIYFDVGSGPSDNTLHNARAPDACFLKTLPTTEIERQARLRLFIVVPGAAPAYPDSGVHTLGTIFRHFGGRLDAIYQVVLDCPHNPDNIRNWIERSASADDASSCVIERGAKWTNDKPQSLSCIATVAPTNPRVLRDLVLQGPTGDANAIPGPSPTPQSPTPANPHPSAPAPSPQNLPANPQPGAGPAPGPLPAPPAPSPQNAATPKPLPVPPANPQRGAGPDQRPLPAPPAPNSQNAATPQPLLVPPASRPQHTATSQPPAPQGPNPLPAPPPPRPGPDPAMVTALADANPTPTIGGTLVSRPLSRNGSVDPVALEFVGNSGGFDLGFRLVNANSNVDVANAVSAKNRLVINSPPSPGLYRIVVTARPRDRSCTGGRTIRGTVNATGQAVAAVEVALNLQISRCAQVTTSIVVGAVEIRR
jgi:hypothetical protein